MSRNFGVLGAEELLRGPLIIGNWVLGHPAELGYVGDLILEGLDDVEDVA